MSIRKSKVFAVAAAACVLGMMLGGCGSSTSGNATEGSNVITAFDSEPQNGLIPGNTNETGGGRPIDLLFAGLVSFDKDGKAQNEVLSPLPPMMTPPSTTSSSRMVGSSPMAPM